MSRRPSLTAGAAAAVTLAAAAACGPGVVHVAVPPAGGLVVEACDHLVNHLPVTLDGLRSRVVAPKSPQVHAWGSPPVVMRCGVPRPPGFSTSSPETVTVNGIVWFQRTSGDTVIWTAIRPQADVELAVPMSYAAQGGYLVELATALKAAAAS